MSKGQAGKDARPTIYLPVGAGFVAACTPLKTGSHKGCPYLPLFILSSLSSPRLCGEYYSSSTSALSPLSEVHSVRQIITL